jgi:hypothetical protein
MEYRKEGRTPYNDGIKFPLGYSNFAGLGRIVAVAHVNSGIADATTRAMKAVETDRAEPARYTERVSSR